MKAPTDKAEEFNDDLDIRDHVIRALYLSLKSERETREALLEAAQLGAKREVLEAIASDPIPIFDEPALETTVNRVVERFLKKSAGQFVENFGAGR